MKFAVRKFCTVMTESLMVALIRTCRSSYSKLRFGKELIPGSSPTRKRGVLPNFVITKIFIMPNDMSTICFFGFDKNKNPHTKRNVCGKFMS